MFKINSDFKPMRDQPQAIEKLVDGINKGMKYGVSNTVTSPMNSQAEPATNDSESVLKAMDLQGRNNLAFQGVNSSLMEKVTSETATFSSFSLEKRPLMAPFKPGYFLSLAALYNVRAPDGSGVVCEL